MTRRDCGETAVIELQGEIDIRVADALHDRLTTALADGSHVVLDLAAVSLIDCACLGALMRARRRADRDHRMLILTAPAPLVERTLRLTGLDTAFPIFRDAEQAVAWLRNCGTRRPDEPTRR